MKGSPRPFAPRPLTLAVRKAVSGVSLVELLLFAGVVAAGTAVVLGLAVNTRATAKREQAQSDIRAFHGRLLSSYGATANYKLLTTDSARMDDLFPPEMLDPVTRQPITPWGGAVRVAGTARPGRPDGSSVVITLEGVPAGDCAPLVSSLASGFTEIVINDLSVGAGRHLDVGQLGAACSGRQGNLIQLFLDDPHAQDELGACSGGGTTETEIHACPGGELGSIHRQRLWTCGTLYDPPVPGPWTEVVNTCTSVCEVPTPNPQIETRPGGSCPVGQLGSITESRTLTYTCAAPTGSPTIEHSEWAVSENTCAPVCVAPPSQTDTQKLGCPSGQLGEIVQEQTTTWSCPSLTGSPTPTTTPWLTVSNTCAPACVAPPATTDTRTVDCAVGQHGRITQTQTTSWSCPSLTGSPTPTTTDWITTANTCASCPAPTSQTEDDWEPRSKACRPGQLGTHSWEELRRRTRTVSYDCPAGTDTLPSPTQGSWSGWSWTGTKRGEVNTCGAVCQLPNPDWEREESDPIYEVEDHSCPQGQRGHVRWTYVVIEERYRTASCPPEAMEPRWSPWGSWSVYSRSLQSVNSMCISR